tara:strand:+ start:336 stop:533 length:198 start_codon:yes stop_codon:yes gene_type:complete
MPTYSVVIHEEVHADNHKEAWAMVKWAIQNDEPMLVEVVELATEKAQALNSVDGDLEDEYERNLT